MGGIWGKGRGGNCRKLVTARRASNGNFWDALGPANTLGGAERKTVKKADIINPGMKTKQLPQTYSGRAGEIEVD